MLCRPARCPHAAGVGKCCPGSNLQTHGWAQAAFCGLRIRRRSVPAGAMESCPANTVHSRKSVIFYPVIPVCIAISVRSKSLSEPVTPLPRLNGSAGCPVPGSASSHAAPGFRRHQKNRPRPGTAFSMRWDHQILVMSTRSTSLMVVSMSRHSVRAMAVSTAVRQAMDRSTALRRICTECSAGLRPVALVEIR